MPQAQRYIVHVHKATVSPPNAHSGDGTWSSAGAIAVTDAQGGDAFAFDGAEIEEPPSLQELSQARGEYALGGYDGTKFKSARMYLRGKTETDQKAFAHAISDHAHGDVIITVRGWGDCLDLESDVHTAVYWAKIDDPKSLSFLVFSAADTKIKDDGTTKSTLYCDYSKTGEPDQAPSGRLGSLDSSVVPPPGIGNCNAQRQNPSLLETG